MNSPLKIPPPRVSQARDAESASSAIRRTFIKYIDTLAALLITLAIFGSAYFLRIQPQLEALDGQMSGVSEQIIAVNENIRKLGSQELVQLRLTTQGLQHQMENLATQATDVGGELGEAVKLAPEVSKTVAHFAAAVSSADARVSGVEQPLRELRATVDQLGAKLTEIQDRLGGRDKKAFPPLYEQAGQLAARLDRIEAALGKPKSEFPDLLARAEKLQAKLDGLQAQLDGKARPFPDVRAEAQALVDELAALKKRATKGVVACSDIRDKTLLRGLRKAGHCK